MAVVFDFVSVVAFNFQFSLMPLFCEKVQFDVIPFTTCCPSTWY